MKKRSTYLLLITIVLGIVLAVLGVTAISEARGTLPVVVVAPGVSIEPFTRLETQHLTVVEMAKIDVRKGMYADPKSVAGKIIRCYLPEGTPIRTEHFAPEGEKGLLGANITSKGNPQLRAYPLPVTDKGLSARLVKGDRVDVVIATQLPIGLGSAQEPVAQIIAAGAEVIDVVRDDKGKASEVIIAITPEQGKDIDFALLKGRVSLMLNPYETDLAAAITEPTTAKSFIEKYIGINQEQIEGGENN